jgi:hypothetical protein
MSQMTSSSLNELSGLLWRERDVLDLVVSRLETDDADWQHLLRSISSLELHRAITAREVALESGLAGDATLDEIAAAMPSEWSSILAGHANALRELTSEVARLVPANGVRVGSDRAPGAVVQRSLREFLSA